MSKLDGDTLKAVIALGTLGVTLLNKGFKDSKLSRVVKDTPTSKIPTAAMGSYVEIKGVLEAPRNERYIAPLSSKECSYFIWRVERLLKNKNGSKWIPLHTTYSASHILVRGESGELAAVSLQNIEGDFGTYKVKTIRFDKPENLPEKAKQYYLKRQFRKVFATLFNFNMGQYRIIEEVVSSGVHVYALGYASKPKTIRPARSNRKTSFYDSLIPINELKNIKSSSDKFSFFLKRRDEMSKQVKIILKPMKKEGLRLFQLNKVYLSSKGEESLIKKGGLTAKFAIWGGAALVSVALWLSTHFFRY